MLKSLPILDMSLLQKGEKSIKEFQEQLRNATHKIGFFYLVGHGIPTEVLQEVFEQSRQFFSLPLEEKLKIEMIHSPQFRGYNRIGNELTQGQIDYREQIDIAQENENTYQDGMPNYLKLEGPNQWPSSLPKFQEVFTDWMNRCHNIGMQLVQAWAESLGAPADFFDSAFENKPAHLLKLVKYPGKEDRGQGVGAHKDPGVLTLLMIEPDKAGLQVEYQDQWIDAEPVSGAFVVNIGELMEYATNGYLKATMHKVVSPPEGENRLSIPFFFNPALDSSLSPIKLAPKFAKHATGVTNDPENVISGTFGENLLKARLRSHPDVAEKFHPDLLQ